MNRLIATTAVALVLGLAPALAAEELLHAPDRRRRFARGVEASDPA